MGKQASPPPVPSASQTAQAQATANVDTAAAQAALNYVNQTTPYGSTTYTQSGDYTTPSGQTVPTYSENVSLSPLGQSILTGQQNIANSLIPAAQGVATQAATSTQTPLNFNTPFSPTLNKAPDQINSQAADAIYGQQKSFLDPQWNDQQKQLEDKLSQQGIPVGSEAYSNAMTQFNNAKTQAYQSAQDSAVAGGSAAAGNLFNLALAGQQQNIGQQETAQTEPLSILQQIEGSQPSTPTQPITNPAQIPIAPTDVIGANAAATNAAMQSYQAQLAQQNSMFGGLASLGGAGITGLFGLYK